MQRSLKGVLVVAATGLGALVGCAVGTAEDTTVGTLASTPIEAGAEDEGESVKIPPPSNPPADPPEDDEDAGAGDAGDAGGGDAGGGDAGGGGTVNCASTNTCVGATDLGSVRGDKGSDTKSAQGSTSQWFKVRVTEDDNDVFGTSLQMKATLVSPAGANFDLFVYNPSTGQECSLVKAQSTSTSSSDSASIEFGESGTFSNGDDDSRNVTIEVRHVSGTCSSTAKWTLTVFGNQL